ncbi:MAG: type III-A CRISPR-associated RAMP protein Csm5 [Desulfocapsaceae bacterium]|nr:type III-A CRISPR-associated RAMP protein Csm5 [Desulfocapsaceae bacterium]
MAIKTVDFRQQSKPSPAQVTQTIGKDHAVYFRLTTASPLHIGCDEVYEPTSFVIDMKTKELVSFETASLLKKLDSATLKKFSEICKKGTVVSLLELFKFMHSQADLAEGQRIMVPDAFVQHYESTLNLPQNERTVGQELNNFQIKRTSFDPLTSNAYIPGSAIKGAIRTAVLNLRNNGRSTPQFTGRDAGRKLQEQLLGFEFNHLETDPFRLLKVSDFFPVNDTARAVTYAVDKKKKPSDIESQAPYQILETVEPGAEFIGSITVLAPPGKDAKIQKHLSLDEITKALAFFYGSEKQNEDEMVRSIGVSPVELVVNGKSLPIRVGRHSGAECVTVNGHRNIKIMQGRNNPDKYLDHATTVWLAAGTKKPTSNQGLKPFGWVALEQLGIEEGQELKKKAERNKAKVIEALQEKIARQKKREEERCQQEAKQLQKERENAAQLASEVAEKEAAAEKERQALAAMTDIERDVYIIQKSETPDNEIAAIYNKLDTLDNQEDQKAISTALKSRWETAGKWARNQCNPAQWEKVKKVKSFLATEPENTLLTPEEQATVEKIQAIKGWSKDVSKEFVEGLPLVALQKLQLRMKDEWGCDEKRAKDDKKKAWSNVKAAIRRHQQA